MRPRRLYQSPVPAHTGEMPGRRVEMSSYHAMLGCVIAGMGVSLLPKSVLEAYPERKRLGVHNLPTGQDRAQTVVFWRKRPKRV